LSSSWYDYKPLASAPTAAEGRVYYNSTDHKLYCYDGTTWQALF
jgi:outer membrane protein assembly factor BamB